MFFVNSATLSTLLYKRKYPKSKMDKEKIKLEIDFLKGVIDYEKLRLQTKLSLDNNWDSLKLSLLFVIVSIAFMVMLSFKEILWAIITTGGLTAIFLISVLIKIKMNSKEDGEKIEELKSCLKDTMKKLEDRYKLLGINTGELKL